MDLIEAEKMANRLMQKHGITDRGWTFEFDRAVNRLGAAHPSRRSISISKHMTAVATPEIVEQVILHEIAHVLTARSSKPHGPEWLRQARAIGYTEGRTMENPYNAHRKPRPTKRNYRPEETTAKPVGINSKLQLKPNVTAVIFKRAQTRWHARGSDGNKYTIPFSIAHQYAID